MLLKLIRLFVGVIFLAGVSFAALCHFTDARSALNCCAKKTSIPSDSESCFSHCAKQKTAAIETEVFRAQDHKAPSILKANPFTVLHGVLLDPGLLKRFYLRRVVPKYLTDQVYRNAVFSRAPPLSL